MQIVRIERCVSGLMQEAGVHNIVFLILCSHTMVDEKILITATPKVLQATIMDPNRLDLGAIANGNHTNSVSIKVGMLLSLCLAEFRVDLDLHCFSFI